MRILLMSAAGLAALTALPAAAQSYPPAYSGGYGSSYSRVAVPRPWQVQSMIDAAERRGEISSDRASDLREQAQDLGRLDRRAQRDDDNGDARRALTSRTFAVLRELRDARADGGNDDAYRGGSRDYPPAYRSTTPQRGYGDTRPAPGYDDDQADAPPPGSDDAYRSAPPADNQYRAPSPYDRNRAAPDNDDRYRAAPQPNDPYRSAPPANDQYRAAPPPNDDQGYDDPNGPDDDGAPPPDDGIYQPRSN